MRTVAICTGPYTHLDHLGVLAAFLNVPLIVTDENHHALAQEFYPTLNVQLMAPSDLSLEFMASSFDLLLQSGRFFTAQTQPLFDWLHQKKMRIAFCPHGHSEKGHSFTVHPEQDISLVYGDHMIDLLKKSGAFSQIKKSVVTGNYRYPYYLSHKGFYGDLVTKKIAPHLDPKKKTIFFAPTWPDAENPSSFFDQASPIISTLSPHFNLIIKLHPLLEENHPALVHCLIENHRDRALFLENFPAIYPLLDLCDIYLGDSSSIGYDFLVFDKPLYFLPPEDKNSRLRECGLTLRLENPAEFIKETMKEDFSRKRRELYHYAFGRSPSLKGIEREISRC